MITRTASDAVVIDDSIIVTGITAPVFSGLATVVAVGNAAYLQWSAAFDDRESSANVVYKIFRASSMGAENFASPVGTTAPGQLSYLDQGLGAGTYYYVVRAQDSAGNRESNVVEHSVVVGSSSGGASPVVGNYIPSVNSQITPNTPIQFDITDDEDNFRHIFIEVTFDDTTGAAEVVHDGIGFRALYAAASSRTIISGGYRYIIRRSGGWPGTPFFKTFAIDHAGNETDDL